MLVKRFDTASVTDSVSTNVVSFRMEWLREQIATLKARDRSKNAAAFGRAIGQPRTRVYEMLKGKRRLQSHEVPRAARWLGMSEAEILALIDSKNGSPDMQNRPTLSQPGHIDASESPLLVWQTAPLGVGRQGAFMLTKRDAGETERPKWIRTSEKAFAINVVDADNVPVFRIGDEAVVDPDGTPDEEDECLFTNLAKAVQGTESVIGVLKRSTGRDWILTQYSSAEERSLPKAVFPDVWRIVGCWRRPKTKL